MILGLLLNKEESPASSEIQQKAPLLVVYGLQIKSLNKTTRMDAVPTCSTMNSITASGGQIY